MYLDNRTKLLDFMVIGQKLRSFFSLVNRSSPNCIFRTWKNWSCYRRFPLVCSRSKSRVVRNL